MDHRHLLGLVAFLALLLGAYPANAWSCADGLVADNITPTTNPDDWTPTLVYGNGPEEPPTNWRYAAASGIWSSTTSDSLRILGSIAACIVGGGYSATLTAAKDADTYYACSSTHGWPGAPAACFPYHPGGSPSGIAPGNSSETVIERAQIADQGDGVSLLEASSDVFVRETWFRYVHDDVIEKDWCSPVTIVVQDNFIDKAFMLFAWDLRTGESPCDDRASDEDWYIDRNIAELHRFAHSFEERVGHGGVFKDANEAEWNPRISSFTDNVFMLGPVIGAGQVVFPDPDWLGESPCEGNVYLWRGLEEDVPVVPTALADCITIVSKLDTETEAVFRTRAIDELGGYSFNEYVAGWKVLYFPPPGGGGGGCGIGPELAALIPLLGAIRRRRARARS